jgi:hypothetical protein
MFISALLTRRSRPALVFYLPQALQGTRGAPCSSNFVTGASNVRAVFALWSSQLYLNDNRAKQKRDFPSRGQWRSPACKSVGLVLGAASTSSGVRVAPVMDWSESSSFSVSWKATCARRVHREIQENPSTGNLSSRSEE